MPITDDDMTSVREALADGVLLDVTELAESVGLHASVLISAGYWATPPVARTEAGLEAALRELVEVFENGRGDDLDGQTLWSYPHGLKDGNELANVFRLWRTEDGRLRLIVLARGESLDFRARRAARGGSFYIQ